MRTRFLFEEEEGTGGVPVSSDELLINATDNSRSLDVVEIEEDTVKNDFKPLMKGCGPNCRKV